MPPALPDHADREQASQDRTEDDCIFLFLNLALILLTNIFCLRLHNAFYNTTAEYNSIDLIPAGAVAVSDTDVTRKETNLSFLFIELVRSQDGIFLDARATLVEASQSCPVCISTSPYDCR